MRERIESDWSMGSKQPSVERRIPSPSAVTQQNHKNTREEPRVPSQCSRQNPFALSLSKGVRFQTGPVHGSTSSPRTHLRDTTLAGWRSN